MLEDCEILRLMVLDCEIGDIEYKYFMDIFFYLYEGDCLVLNEMKVMFVCLYGVKEDIGVYIEVFFLK